MRRLTAILLKAYRFALRRPRLTLALAAALVLSLAAQAPRSRILLAVRDMADPGMRSTRWNARMDAAFGVEHEALLVFHPVPADAPFTPAAFAAIRAWVVRERAENAGVLRILSAFDVPRPELSGGSPRLVPAVAGSDPAALQALVDTPWGGILTDREARDVAVQVVLAGGRGSRWFGSFDPAPIVDLERRCRRELLAANPGIAMHLAGTAAFDRYALDGVRRFQSLNLAVVVILVLLMRVLFGSWRGGLLISLVLVGTTVAVYGGMALAGAPIDLLSVGLFLLLAVTVVEDFLFLSHDQLASGGSWRRSFRQLLLPGFLTSLTTVAGFASLCVADTATVRRLGMWGGIGAALEWAATFLVLPALLVCAPRLQRWTFRERAVAPRLVERLVVRRLPRAAAWFLLLALFAAVGGAGRLNYNDTPVRMFAAGHPYREGLEYLRRTRGWVGQFSVVFPEGVEPGDIVRATDDLRGDPAVAAVVDPWSVLRYLSGDNPSRLLELAADPAAAGPASAQLRGAGGRLRAAVFVREADLATLGRLRDRVAALFPDGGGYPAGELMTYADFGDTVPRTLVESLLTCVGIVGMLIVGLCRILGLGWGVLPLLASLWGPAVVVLAVWALRVPINFLTCAFATVLVGITGDNAVQFACATTRSTLGTGIARRGGAALLVSAVMAAAALVFLGSIFVPPQRLGLLLAAGLCAAAFGDVWILGALARTAGAGRTGTAADRKGAA